MKKNISDDDFNMKRIWDLQIRNLLANKEFLSKHASAFPNNNQKISPKSISFITGTGRCGTVTLSKILSLSDKCIVFHEGFCKFESSRDSLLTLNLPTLFLENLEAYLDPTCAEKILCNKRRAAIMDIFLKFPHISHFCEIAFYFAPFVKVLNKIFPESRLAVIIRDGRYFVWSAYTGEFPDPMPIGYNDKELPSDNDRHILRGRLCPKENTPEQRSWLSYSAFQKNCWLWAETNRLILEGIKKWPPESTRIFYFEDLFTSSKSVLPLLEFLHIGEINEVEIARILEKKCNERRKKALPNPNDWDSTLLKQFNVIAGSIMEKLNYY